MKANVDQQGSLVKEECPVNLDLPDQEEKTDLKDLMENQDHQDLRDLLDTKVPLGWLVYLVSEVFPGLKVLRVEEVIQAFLDQLVLMAGLARGDNKALLVPQDPLGKLEVLEIQCQQDLLVNRAQLV